MTFCEKIFGFLLGPEGKNETVANHTNRERQFDKSHNGRRIIVKKSVLREFAEDFLFALAAIGGLILITAFLFAITPAVPRP